MENKISIICIIIKKIEIVPEVNHLLSLYGNYIIGRMGIPFHEKKVNIISVVIDSKRELVESLVKKLSEFKGVEIEIAYSNI